MGGGASWIHPAVFSPTTYVISRTDNPIADVEAEQTYSGCFHVDCPFHRRPAPGIKPETLDQVRSEQTLTIKQTCGVKHMDQSTSALLQVGRPPRHHAWEMV
jgi:hypothetical protein